MRDYIRTLRDRLEKRVASFVPTNARYRDGRTFRVEEWLAAHSPVTYITDEFGCGKTAFGCFLLLGVCRHLEASSAPSIVPVLVNLTDLEVDTSKLGHLDPTSDDALSRLLALTPPVMQPPASDLPWLVLLDGLDELAGAQGEAIIAKLLEIAAHSPNVRFVIASRINALRIHAQALDAAVGSENLPTHSNTLALPQFHEDQMSEFLRRRISDPARFDEAYRFLSGRRNLHELTARPLILSLLTQSSMGEPSVLDHFIRDEPNDAAVTLSYVFDAIVERCWQRLRRSSAGHDVDILSDALGRIAYRQLKRPVMTPVTILEEVAAIGVPKERREAVARTLLTATFLTAHESVPGRYQFEFRSFRDYFIGLHLRRLENLRDAVQEFPDALQSTFCQRGIVDFLRDLVGDEHKAFLVGLLSGTDETMVFASHLMRNRTFLDCVPHLEDAFHRCSDPRGRVFIVFAIMSHLGQGDPRANVYASFMRENRSTFRDTLKLFVDGVEQDVMEFNVERLGVRAHRSKAVLYLSSLLDPDIHSVDQARVRSAVQRFVRDGRPSDLERELSTELLVLTDGAGPAEGVDGPRQFDSLLHALVNNFVTPCESRRCDPTACFRHYLWEPTGHAPRGQDIRTEQQFRQWCSLHFGLELQPLPQGIWDEATEAREAPLLSRVFRGAKGLTPNYPLHLYSLALMAVHVEHARGKRLGVPDNGDDRLEFCSQPYRKAHPRLVRTLYACLWHLRATFGPARAIEITRASLRIVYEDRIKNPKKLEGMMIEARAAPDSSHMTASALAALIGEGVGVGFGEGAATATKVRLSMLDNHACVDFMAD